MKPKFRAKTLGSNEWVYGSYITMFNQHSLSEINTEHYIYDGVTYHIVDITTVCQCVGTITERLLNKVKGCYIRTFKDVDLYIGDIITCEDEYDSIDGFSSLPFYINYVVEWNEEEWSIGFRQIIDNDKLSDEIYSLDDLGGGLSGMWLTGNIFDSNYNFK